MRIVSCSTENFCGNVESKVNIEFKFKTGFGSIKSDWLSKKSRRREEIVFYLNNGKTLIIDYVGMNLRDGDGNIYYQAEKKYNDMDYEYDLLVKDVIDTLSKNKNLVFLEERIKPLEIIFSCYDDFMNNTFQNLTDLNQAEIIKAFSFYVNHKKFPSGFNTHRINFIGDDGLYYFRLLGKNKNYFVKIYKNKKNIFLKELKNYTYFYKNLKLNIPARYFTYCIDEYDLIIYDYISDFTLYDLISSRLKKNFNVSGKIIKKSINQVVNLLVSEVQADYQASEWTKFCPLDFFNIKFVSKKSKSNFLSAYNAVLDIVALANKNNQIYYTDRNPRNMMVKENDIFQIDFEVIENISSLFDLIKLLRNGYDCNKFGIPKMASLSSLNEFLETKRAFNLKEESFYIKYFFRKIGLSAEDFSFQRILYDILSLHTHLFYVGIYFERIRRIDYLSVKVLNNRLKYHYYESIFLLNKFKDFETYKSFTPHFLVNPSDFKKIIRNVDTQVLIRGLSELII